MSYFGMDAAKRKHIIAKDSLERMNANASMENGDISIPWINTDFPHLPPARTTLAVVVLLFDDGHEQSASHFISVSHFWFCTTSSRRLMNRRALQEFAESITYEWVFSAVITCFHAKKNANVSRWNCQRMMIRHVPQRIDASERSVSFDEAKQTWWNIVHIPSETSCYRTVIKYGKRSAHTRTPQRGCRCKF